ncbi:MAG: 16S rRNA (cytidine(1402)-2'-O)-methyltransferase [Elusimicrobia bacterium]|nr:16S rRNA (cytidine(1402)-2'-O)-methyltransferase [Elusimicrobiota bacterium]
MLYIVPTPLGNLEDMPPRAVKVLKEVAGVFCEDTRRTRNLMSHFGIPTPLYRYHEQDPRSVEGLLGRLRQGQNCALVSDAGLPGISDPGGKVVCLARQAGLPVTALPGPSAVTAALAGSGLPADSFVFLGFLPRSETRQKRILAQAAALGKTLVIYESPHRVVKLLAHAEMVLGPSARACAVRELSKMHEEWLHGTVAEVRRILEERPQILGEFVVMTHPEKNHARDDHSA